MTRQLLRIASVLLVICWAPFAAAPLLSAREHSVQSAKSTFQTRKHIDSTLSREIDRYVKSEMLERGIPGVALAVDQRGRAVVRSAFGLANVELGVPLKPDAVFQIASLTKIVTAAAVMMLVDEGKLRLEGELGAIIPALPRSWQRVTLRQCMSHTSGLPEVVTDPSTGSVIADEPAEALRRLTVLPPFASPGDQWVYGQTGYLLAQLAIEKVSGQRFAAFLKDRVYRAAGMRNTTWGDFRSFVTGRVSYYARPPAAHSGIGDPIPFFQLRFPPVMESGAGLNSTADDLLALVHAIDEGKLIRHEAAEAMWTDTPLNSGHTAHYGVGWTIFDDSRGRRLVGHTGANSSTLLKDLEAGVTVIVLTNLSGADPESIARHVLDLVVSK